MEMIKTETKVNTSDPIIAIQLRTHDLHLRNR